MSGEQQGSEVICESHLYINVLSPMYLENYSLRCTGTIILHFPSFTSQRQASDKNLLKVQPDH